MRSFALPPLVAIALATTASAQFTSNVDTRVLVPPCQTADARFGHSLAVLDMDAEGEPDLAVGAWGEDVVYVFYGAGNSAGAEAYQLVRLFTASGPKVCPAVPDGSGFGYDVAGGQLDGDLAGELVVGAPFASPSGVAEAGAAYLFGGVTGSTPLPLVAAAPEAGAMFGNSVTTGDFDGDGHRDVAIGAPAASVAGVKAGRVHVFFGPFDAPPVELVLDNPLPVTNGNFGTHLAAADADGDGDDELYVSAIGNTSNGIVYAGQIFVYPGPIDPAVHVVVEDPAQDPADQPSPRFGMHIDARGDLLAIGANRKDWVGVHDAGMGFTCRAPAYGSVQLHPHPHPMASDYLGFRCILADVVGDSTVDATFIVMATQGIPNANWRALLTWDGTDLAGPPVRMRRTLPGTADHFGNGSGFLPAAIGGKEAIVLGDPTFDRPGTGKQDDAGRVVLYYY